MEVVNLVKLEKLMGGGDRRGESAQQKLPDWQDGESVKLAVGSRQTKLNFLSGLA